MADRTAAEYYDEMREAWNNDPHVAANDYSFFCAGFRAGVRHLDSALVALDAMRAENERLVGLLENLLDALPKCSCGAVATREDCNLDVGCDEDAHVCGEDGGPTELPWAKAARAALEKKP